MTDRTLLDEWAYARPYRSEQERRGAFPAWLHTYNHHRGHTALKGKPPAGRVTNLTGQYTWRSPAPQAPVASARYGPNSLSSTSRPSLRYSCATDVTTCRMVSGSPDSAAR